jgi:photosystem II stability/assembly factor-like uncharacterized protein
MTMKNFTIIILCLSSECAFNLAYTQWLPLTSPLEGMNFLMNMHFINDSAGFVLQQSITEPGLYNRILKTIDYGMTWDTIHNDFQTHAATNYYYEDIFFINEQIGWICGTNMPFILKTTDGGDSWLAYDITGEEDYLHIRFITDNFGLVLGGDAGGTTSETLDGGLTWSLNPNFNGQKISFADSCNFLVAGGNVNLQTECEHQFITIEDSSEGIEYDCRAVQFNNNQNWMLGSLGLIGFTNIGSILKTLDGGITFYTLHLNFTSNVGAFYFLNDNFGFARISPINTMPCTLLKTNDGGIVWNCQETPMVQNNLGENIYIGFKDMDLRNENLMYAMSGTTIYRTTNGGGPLGDTYTGVKVTPHKSKTLSLYPNPTSSSFSIEVTQPNEVRAIEIYNATGQIVAQYATLPNEMDVHNWPSGCYNVVVKYDNEVVRTRVIVE